jgi:hypothetical protein
MEPPKYNVPCDYGCGVDPYQDFLVPGKRFFDLLELKTVR